MKLVLNTIYPCTMFNVHTLKYSKIMFYW